MHSYRTSLPRRLSRKLKTTTTSTKPTTTQTRTMAFFPRNFYNTTGASDASFTPLFRLLDDFDSYSRGNNCQGGLRQTAPSWQPKFDVRETGEAYELHGELPGLSKENVNIEFTEPQTMLVRGRVERTYTAGTPPTGQIEGAAPAGKAITENKDEHRKSHQPTVSDEEDEDTEIVSSHDQQEHVEKETQETPAKAADKAKYWLTERSIGEFARTFNFPARVDQDAVSASLQDGILTVSVPKAKKHETRRIAIN
jgi:HSP20 family molecular chaperone IbpA